MGGCIGILPISDSIQRGFPRLKCFWKSKDRECVPAKAVRIAGRAPLTVVSSLGKWVIDITNVESNYGFSETKRKN